MTRAIAALNYVVSTYALFVVEAIVVLVTIIIAFLRPDLGNSFLRRTEPKFSQFARRPYISIVAVGVLALAGRAALLPLVPIPVPGVHDEFSYLLAADTFASGHITNPTHPMWVHFESIHILQEPTYSSMYPVAQGLVLAVGKILFDQPWWGVWLSAGIMCAVLTWMLQAWLPPQWALLGGLIAVVRIGLFSFWMNGYMGGAVAAIGGSLVLGALPRIVRYRRSSDALLMGVGLAILANSRPNEGLFLALGVGVVLISWLLAKKFTFSSILKRVVLPLAPVLLITFLAMGFYFKQVTQSPFRMPYFVNRATYAMAPSFLFQHLRPEPHYNYKPMQDYYEWERDVYNRSRSPTGLLIRTLGKFLTLWVFYFGPALTLPLIMFPRVLRDKRLRLLLIAGAVGMIGILVPVWFNAQYAAPLTGVFYAVMLQGMRHLRACRWRGKETGLLLARSIPLICLLMIPVRLGATSLGLNIKSDWRQTWSYASAGMMDRAALLKRLESTPGSHLVIVRYKPDHDFHSEWVYNEANIDTAKVVWAREMDPASDRELINYFKDRDLWLLEGDEKPPRLSPYPVRALGNGDDSKR